MNPCDQIGLAWALLLLGIGVTAGAIAALLSVCALERHIPKRPYRLRRP